MTRYKAEIRADLLQVYGADLGDWLRSERWSALVDLIDQLPSACRVNEAIAQDDEAADELVAMLDDSESEGPDWSPRVAEFDLTNTMLAQLINEVKLLGQTIIASNGGKAKKIKPFPTPRTAIDRARERQDTDMFYRMQAKFGFGRASNN